MRNGILLFLLMTVSLPAMAIYKCEAQGRVTYTDIPCGAAQTTLPPVPLPADAAGARQQAADERRELAAIAKSQETERVTNERKKRSSRKDRTALAHQKKCALLGLERKWSAEDAASNPHTISEKTQGLKKAARRKAERHEAECGAGA